MEAINRFVEMCNKRKVMKTFCFARRFLKILGGAGVSCLMPATTWLGHGCLPLLLLAPPRSRGLPSIQLAFDSVVGDVWRLTRTSKPPSSVPHPGFPLWKFCCSCCQVRLCVVVMAKTLARTTEQARREAACIGVQRRNKHYLAFWSLIYYD